MTAEPMLAISRVHAFYGNIEALRGVDIEIGDAVCKVARLRCSWVETSFDGLIPALQGRKFDAINSAMNATEKRREAIDFTNIIYRVPSVLIARKDSGLLPTPESLKGKRVGVLQASIQETYAKVHWEPAGVIIVPYQDQNLVYADLRSGRLDGTLVLAPETLQSVCDAVALGRRASERLDVHVGMA